MRRATPSKNAEPILYQTAIDHVATLLDKAFPEFSTPEHDAIKTEAMQALQAYFDRSLHGANDIFMELNDPTQNPLYQETLNKIERLAAVSGVDHTATPLSKQAVNLLAAIDHYELEVVEHNRAAQAQPELPAKKTYTDLYKERNGFSATHAFGYEGGTFRK